MKKWLIENMIFAIPLWNWVPALLLGSAVFFGSTIFLRIAVARCNQLSGRSGNKSIAIAAELLARTNRILLALASFIIGLSVLTLSTRWSAAVAHLWFIVLAVQIGLWGDQAIKIWRRDHLALKAANPVTATLISLLVQGVIWITIFLSILDNAGVNITALVASLGVGGVAVALAVQTILGDLFASISIGVDKPFEIGDFIVFGNTMGTVEHIGLKSTRIRSLDGEQIISSNTELLKQTIHNFKRMTDRRVVFHFNLSYRTPADKIEQVPGMVRNIISSHSPTRLDRVHFSNFGVSALEFEAVYYILDPDYNRYMDIQQSINLDIMHKLAELDVNFALPERTVEIIHTRKLEEASADLGRESADGKNRAVSRSLN